MMDKEGSCGRMVNWEYVQGGRSIQAHNLELGDPEPTWDCQENKYTNKIYT